MEFTFDFAPVLDKLIADAPPENKDGAECQITLANGATIAGALTRPADQPPGFYAIKAIMRRGDERTGPPGIVDLLFHSRGVFLVTVPRGAVERPQIIVPNMSPSRMG